ncbi:PatA/PatG family cyanobactin maturation protease [Coleofasciculus chthonoplastes]|uniref:PatA/PatG family cyanobactin maturation protease n=1 Tax=Coleofasciculus chthonoplastes TaxID=64178 RepID=UPI0032FFECA6
MNHSPFNICLSTDIQVQNTEKGYLLRPSVASSLSPIALAKTPGTETAFAHLQAGNTTTASLLQALTDLDGQAAAEQFSLALQQFEEQGWLHYTVLPLAVAVPMVQSAELTMTESYGAQTEVMLSRFAYQHPYEGSMVLESPLSKFRVKLLDWRASALLAQLAQPQTLRSVTPPPHLGPETAYQFLSLLWATGFLTVMPEPPSLQLWDFHNLLFHSRSRLGRHDYPIVDYDLDHWSDFPVVKPPMSDRVIPLPRPNMGALTSNDGTLTEAIERRQSVREYDDNHPIGIEQLGEFLYRTARIKELLSLEEWFGELPREILREFGADIDYGELSRRPYPGGGEMYELEVYPVVRHCQGLNPGIYHYDPLNHQIEQIIDSAESQDDVFATSGYYEVLNLKLKIAPQVLLVITARFGRLFRKYRAIGYGLLLKHVGVLQQNFYLVATNMALAPCALGSGDSDAFGRAVGLDYVEESVVGEFIVGSLPNRDVEASGLESSEVGISDSTKVAAFVSEVDLDITEAEPESADVGFRASTQSTQTEPGEIKVFGNQLESVGLVAEIASAEVGENPENTSVQVEDTGAKSADLTTADPISETPDSLSVAEGESESAAVSASDVESSATPIPLALHPHDLDNRIPGLAELHNQTLGDPRITIVVIDGEPDYTLSCLQGAEVSKAFPYWHEPAEAIPQEDYTTFREIRDQGLKGKAKQEALEAAIPETRNRVELNDHACHVTSVIVGQEHSPVFGLAPRCRIINMPHDAVLKPDNGIELSGYSEMLSPLNMARALEYALELGANIIHCGFCRPTQTGEGEELLVQAVKKCQDNNVLIVSPTGNNLGECWCMPAVLPGTLAVGAAKVDGTPCHFSNWGGNNAEEGILAPGEDILGAQPYTDKPVRLTGTSMSAPVMTGISALLMSLQLQEGKPVDAEAVRMALLNTAIPCDPDVVEEPDRCLRGFVNISGAMKVLFGQPSVTISFAGDQVTRTQRPGYAMPTPASPAVQPATPTEASVIAAADSDAAPANPATVEASTAFSGNVYALGTLGYDFGDDARRDTFKQLMAPAEIDGIMVPPDPYDPRQMLEHLDRYPDERRSLIWTLNLDQNTIYVLEPKGPFADDIYEVFLLMLAGQLEPDTSDGFVERISLPARRTTRTVELFSGEIVPVVTVNNVRGMYGWTVNALVNAALAAISNRFDPDQEPLIREALSAFLNRVYHDLRNLGQTSRDRALNFAATNIFQSASVFAEAIASERQLDTIEVKKSPYCRINSDCWDVLLIFFDPENGRRSRRVFRFTLDVALNMPVTIGRIKRWSIPGKSHS